MRAVHKHLIKISAQNVGQDSLPPLFFQRNIQFSYIRVHSKVLKCQRTSFKVQLYIIFHSTLLGTNCRNTLFPQTLQLLKVTYDVPNPALTHRPWEVNQQLPRSVLKAVTEGTGSRGTGSNPSGGVSMVTGWTGAADREESRAQQSASPPPDSGLASWLAPAEGTQRERHSKSSESRPPDDLQASAPSWNPPKQACEQAQGAPEAKLSRWPAADHRCVSESSWAQPDLPTHRKTSQINDTLLHQVLGLFVIKQLLTSTEGICFGNGLVYAHEQKE